MKKILFLSLIALGFSFSLSAQKEEKPIKQEQKTYTYEEAVEALTAHEDEFGTKGEIVKIPSIGIQIFNARMKKNVSLSTLAFVIGLNEESMKKVETNLIVPTRDILTKIEDFLGTEIIISN